MVYGTACVCRELYGKSLIAKNVYITIQLTNKEASTVLCSVVKHAAEEVEHGGSVCFSLLLECSAASKVRYNWTVEGSLFVYDKESNNFPTHWAEFSNQTLSVSRGVKAASAVHCSLIKHAKANHNPC